MTRRPTQNLLDALYYEGPKSFTAARIQSEPNLFAVRGALFYTPTARLPSGDVGKGKLDVWLPLAIPTLQEFTDNRSRQSVRLWVDLLQRVSGVLRWTPNCPARVTLIRHDSETYSTDSLCPKSLLDALKQSSNGRRDRLILHYFGAIRDDNNTDLVVLSIAQAVVKHPSMAGTRVIVEAA